MASAWSSFHTKSHTHTRFPICTCTRTWNEYYFVFSQSWKRIYTPRSCCIMAKCHTHRESSHCLRANQYTHCNFYSLCVRFIISKRKAEFNLTQKCAPQLKYNPLCPKHDAAQNFARECHVKSRYTPGRSYICATWVFHVINILNILYTYIYK